MFVVVLVMYDKFIGKIDINKIKNLVKKLKKNELVYCMRFVFFFVFLFGLRLGWEIIGLIG